MFKSLLVANCLIAVILVQCAVANPLDDYKLSCNILQDKFLAESSLRPKLLSTNDHKTLVNASSYLVILDKPKSGHMPLELQALVVEQGQSFYELQLDFGCAIYRISIKSNVDKKEYGIGSIAVSMRSGNGDGEQWWVCSTRPAGLVFPFDKHYSCLGRLVFTCYVYADDEPEQTYLKPVAEMVFPGGLEIELDGLAPAIRENKFSREPHLESCPQ